MPRPVSIEVPMNQSGISIISIPREHFQGKIGSVRSDTTSSIVYHNLTVIWTFSARPMAPKKKKKAVSNPARGFATVSLPSKSKPGDDAKFEAENVRTDPRIDNVNSKKPQSSTNGATSLEEPSSLHDLTPAQLEEHLEDAELQNLVEKAGDRSKRDAARQVARLETERRTLRTLAMPLETDDWLTQDLTDEVINLSKSASSVLDQSTQSVSPHVKTVQQEELLIRLWTLQQVLKTLHINQEEQVLKHIVSLKTDDILTPKDYVWGLEESFDWLALHADPEDLPQYNLASTVPSQNYNSVPPSSSETSRATSPVRNGPTRTSGFDVAESIPVEKLVLENDDPEERPGSQLASSLNIDYSSDEDNDPELLVGRYIDLRSRLLKVELESAADKRTVNDSKGQERLSASQVSGLRQKVKDIEHDILFDQEKAETQWSETSNRIRSELAEQRRTREAPNLDRDSNLEKETAENPEETNDEMPEADDAGEPLFGEMFSTVEKYAPGRKDTPQSQSDTSIVLIDFGKWTGISPRRVLEETCKAR